MEQPILIRSKPGIQRDGTRFDADAYIDGRWTRFDRGRPRKMGGYRAVTQSLPERVYGMHVFAQNLLQYLHLGSESLLTQILVNNSGSFAGLNDRTPAGLVPDPNNNWQLDALPNAVATTSNIIAHAAPNLDDITDSTETSIFYNPDITDTSILVDTGLDPVSGGICVVGPYLFSYGNAGFVAYTTTNDPTTPDALARITAQKIVYGRSIRGGGNGPSALFWSLDSLIRATFTGAATGPLFAFDTLAEITIMSSRSVVEYDGIQYWWGIDRPMMFNGIVQEVPNDYNIDYFLDNFDFARRQEVFGFKIPRWGEIWWVFPSGAGFQAVIYNVRSRIWYDTVIPGSGRTSGIHASVYGKPFLTDLDLTGSGFTLWQHETGKDEVKGTSVEPVPAFFETADFTLLNGEEPTNSALRIARIEPDFVQVGDMQVQIVGNTNARSPDVESDVQTFPASATGAGDQTVMFKTSRRQLRFRFLSNTLSGDFFMGKIIGQVEPVEKRVTQ